MRGFIFISLLSFCLLPCFSQEGLKPLGSNLSYHYKDLKPTNQNPTHFSTQKTQSVSLQIPFREDFYYATEDNYPRMSLWNDSSVYVNAGYPIAPPSIGVATFDGLNKFGYPYEPNYANSNDALPADTLTSKPINLFQSGTQILQVSDSIALSFYYQARGNGEPPESADSLILDFYNPQQQVWVNNIWYSKGNSNPNTNDTAFKRAFIMIDSLHFLKDGFQFRFRNKATISGNFDHWHIDYVYLNKNRSKKADTTYNDLTFAHVPSSFLQNYWAMPYQQYNPSEMAQQNSVRIKNNGVQTINMSYENKFYDKNLNLIHSYSGGAANLDPFKPHGYSTVSSHAYPLFNYTFAPMTDSCDFTIKHFLYRSQGVSSDFIVENDTIYQKQIFRNYYAYDDGSAEGGYYVNTLNNYKGKIALKFNINYPDTLRAVRIYFDPASSLTAVSQNSRFRINIWQDGVNGRTSIYKDSVMTPFYSDSVFKGIPEYKLSSKQVLSPGAYYIGFQQEIQSGIAVGFDKNQDYHQNLYYDSGAGWAQSTIKGSLMIHPVLGKYVPSPAGIGDEQALNKKVMLAYPNPANEVLYLYSEGDRSLSYVLVNTLGQHITEGRIQNGQHSISTSEFPAGVYFLILNQGTNTLQQNKIIIQH